MQQTWTTKLALVFALWGMIPGGVGVLRGQRVPVLPAAAKDLGRVADGAPIRRMQLMLTRTPAQEKALVELLEEQQDSGSVNFHQWLAPEEFGVRFGASDAAIASMTTELEARGFFGIRVNAGRTLVEFSGSAAAVEAAFHPEIHAVEVGGETRFANRSAGTVPAALVGAVKGFVSLDNLAGARAAAARVRPDWTLASNNTTYYAVTPKDFAAIYDVLPLWAAATPIDGTGESIAIVGDTDINPADFVSFRALFGMPLGNTTSQTGTQYLNIIYNGPKPAVLSDEFHADGDTQWAAAVAKGATIDYVASEGTEASSGNDLSAAYIVDNNLAPVLVDSYWTCEGTLGAGENAFYNALWQQAAAQGITVVAAAGDAGAAGCDAVRVAPAVKGNGVSGIGSTPYNVAVGGTDFYAPNGLGSYFGANGANLQSATGYIPETVWNDTCTSTVVLGQGAYAGLTAEQACNLAAVGAAGLAVVAGGGGGASAVYGKPVWQVAPGVPADGARDMPDVALFASQGRANSFYVVCQQSRNTDGQPCSVNYPYADFAAYGGTELATPAFAGIMALAVEKSGARIGNPNYTLYRLAGLQAGTNCNAMGSPAAGCIFHDVTLGTNAMVCTTGSPGCVTATPGDAYGVLAGGAAGTGYDTASGLGSVDAANLVNSWASVSYRATSAVLSISPSLVMHGQPVTATVTVTANGGVPTGEVSLNAQAGSGSVGAGPLVAGAFVQAFTNLPGGSYGLQAHYAGDAADAGTDSNFVSVTVTPESSATTLRTLVYNPTTGASTNVTAAPYGNIYYVRADVVGASGQGIATGNVAIDEDGAIFGSGVYRLNSSGYTEAQNNSIGPGTHTFAASYAGDSSFNASTAATATLTIARAPTTAVVTTSVATVSIAGVVTLAAVIGTQSFGYAAPTGTVTFYAGTQVLGTSVLVQGSDATTYYRNGTATLTISAGTLTVGSDGITVVYAGDTNYLGSSSPAAPLTVTGTTLALTTTTVTASPATVVPEGTVRLAAMVAPSVAAANAPAAGGTVQFAIDGQNFGVPVAVSANVAVLSASVGALAVGPHQVTAVYSGDVVNYRSSKSNAAPLLVATAGMVSVPNFVATPTTLVQGTFVSVAVTVTPASPVATGAVQLVLDGGPYGAQVGLAGNATATLPLKTGTLQVGTHILTVYYTGDGSYASSYGLPVTLTITAPGITASAVRVTNLPAAIVPGSVLNFTASVTPTSPTPTGIYQVIVDGGNPGTPILLTGAANNLGLALNGLALGSHTLSMFYSGDATYNFSTSPVYSFAVLEPAPVGSFTLTPSQRNLTVSGGPGTTATVAYTVTSVNGYADKVTFSCSSLPAYTACAFSPATTSLLGVASANTTLTMTFSTGFLAANAMPAGPGSAGELPLVALAGLLGLGLCRGSRRWRPALIAMVVTVALGVLSGCSTGYIFGTTPKGTYQVNVIAAGVGVSQSATVVLIVQ